MVSLAFNSQEEINMSQEGRAILESTLGKLLGFDDGASDVLDHLLSVESKEVGSSKQCLVFAVMLSILHQDSVGD